MKNSIITIGIILLFPILCHSQNDDKADAITLTINTVSPEFTTVGGTPDGIKPACWRDGPNFNQWFKFQATSANIDIQLIRGTIKRPNIALWDNSGNVIACEGYADLYSEVAVGAVNLTVGEFYFVTVDNQAYTPYTGTFSLAVYDRISNDFMAGAIEIASAGCTQEYTTIGGTPDLNKGTCWNEGPNFNKWFKFVANSDKIKIELERVTITRPFLSLYDANGIEIACGVFENDLSGAELAYENLVSGQTYYIAVDNHYYAPYKGTFKLCLSNVELICGPLSCDGESVLIGVDDAKGYKLAVGGRIIAEGVKIAKVEDWADFVFNKEHKLTPLKEVENFIDKNHHLPEIPSAAEVKKDGIDLVNMDMKLLQKVEELTLYMIEVNKRVEDLENKNKVLKTENEKMTEEILKLSKSLKN